MIRLHSDILEVKSISDETYLKFSDAVKPFCDNIQGAWLNSICFPQDRPMLYTVNIIVY